MLLKTDEQHTTAVGRRVGAARARRAWPSAVAVVLAAVYCWVTARTTPFSTGANLAVGLALVVAAGLAVSEAVAHWPWRARHPDRTGPDGALWPWWVAIAVLVGWELFNYVQSPRHSYPTVSSIYEHVSRWQWAKAVLIAAWLVLGWEIVVSFAKERAGRREP